MELQKMDCRLCGQNEAEGASKKEPCFTCQSTYPNFKSCRSCGRCFTDDQHFATPSSQRCITCENRRKRKNSDSKTQQPDERIIEKKRKHKKRSDNDFAASTVLTDTKATTPNKKVTRKIKRYLQLILDDSTLVGKIEILK